MERFLCLNVMTCLITYHVIMVAARSVAVHGLDLYEQKEDPKRPLVCFDETSKASHECSGL